MKLSTTDFVCVVWPIVCYRAINYPIVLVYKTFGGVNAFVPQKTTLWPQDTETPSVPEKLLNGQEESCKNTPKRSHHTNPLAGITEESVVPWFKPRSLPNVHGKELFLKSEAAVNKT